MTWVVVIVLSVLAGIATNVAYGLGFKMGRHVERARRPLPASVPVGTYCTHVGTDSCDECDPKTPDLSTVRAGHTFASVSDCHCNACVQFRASRAKCPPPYDAGPTELFSSPRPAAPYTTCDCAVPDPCSANGMCGSTRPPSYDAGRCTRAPFHSGPCNGYSRSNC